MFYDDSIVGSWAALCARLTGRKALECWSRREPVLAAAATVADFGALTAVEAPREQANAVLGAVVRTAARAGGDDADAVLVAVHLLSNGLYASAARLAKAVPDALPLLVVEVAAQIRCCPVERRFRSYPVQLLRTAEHEVLRERFPHYADGDRVPETPMDPCWLAELPPADVLVHSGAYSRHEPGAGGECEIDAVDPIDLLLWAERTAVISRDDVELLLELDITYRCRVEAWKRVAARQQVSDRTLRRRRHRAEAALRAAIRDYLDVAA